MNIHHTIKTYKMLFTLLLIFLLASLSFLLSGCTTKPIESEDREERIPVKVSKIEEGTFIQTIQLPGRSRSQLEFPVLSPSPLPVKDVYVDLGQQVKKGDVLLTFENEQADKQLQEARRQVQLLEKHIAELESAQKELGQSTQAMQGESSEAIRRAQAVIDGAQTGAVTMLDLLQASTQLLLLQNQAQNLPSLDAAVGANPVQLQAQLEQARAQVRLAEEAVERLTVRAPFDGVVTYKYIEPKGTALPNTPLLQVSNLEKLIIDVQVGSTYIAQLRTGMKAHILFEGENEPIEATIDAVSPGTSVQAPLYQTQIYLDNREGQFFPGKLATIEIETKKMEQALLVPVQAIFFQHDKAFVYIVQENVATLREVTLGERNESSFVVLSGLKKDEMVITVGRERVSDGRAVYIQK